MAKNTSPLVSVSGLSVDFDTPAGTLRAIDDMNFTIKRGETLCIVGESGSGKSVTGRALMQLITRPGRIASGSILFTRQDGSTVDIARLQPHGSEIRALRGREIGMIFQEPMSSLSLVYTIGEQIAEVFRLHEGLSRKAARLRAIEALDRVKIPNPSKTVDRYPFEYSGGMRQRAMIAMALACSPSLLIADEPTTALDVTTQADILDLLSGLQAELGMAMLFVTHDIGVVAELADNVMVMRAGKVIEAGTVAEVIGAPTAPYSQALIGAVSKLNSRAPAKAVRPTGDVPMALGINNVGVYFPLHAKEADIAVRAVDGVDLQIRRGETLGIVGESGSGKTTLAKTLVRLIEASAGSVTYAPADRAPIDITTADRSDLKQARGKLRYVFQDPYSSLNPRMTVEQILAEPLKMHGIVPAENYLGELLQSVGMPKEALSRFPHAFSGGQRQRICIARALALKPEVIITDEATASLDVSLRSQILDLMIDLQNREGITYVVISHDMSVVRYFCDRVAVMRHGKLVELGTVEDVCDNPSHPYTQALLASVPSGDLARPSLRALNRRKERFVSLETTV